MGLFGIIHIFIETAMSPAGTSIAGSGGTVAPRAFKGFVVNAFGSTLASMFTFAIIRALKRKRALIG